MCQGLTVRHHHNKLLQISRLQTTRVYYLVVHEVVSPARAWRGDQEGRGRAVPRLQGEPSQAFSSFQRRRPWLTAPAASSLLTLTLPPPSYEHPVRTLGPGNPGSSPLRGLDLVPPVQSPSATWGPGPRAQGGDVFRESLTPPLRDADSSARSQLPHPRPPGWHEQVVTQVPEGWGERSALLGPEPPPRASAGVLGPPGTQSCPHLRGLDSIPPTKSFCHVR